MLVLMLERLRLDTHQDALPAGARWWCPPTTRRLRPPKKAYSVPTGGAPSIPNKVGEGTSHRAEQGCLFLDTAVVCLCQLRVLLGRGSDGRLAAEGGAATLSP